MINNQDHKDDKFGWILFMNLDNGIIMLKVPSNVTG